jgi:peptidoglycan/LPS O-acetylase OafA/YrhL
VTTTDDQAPTVAGASQARHVNSFDGLRLLGALAVIYGHSSLLVNDAPWHPDVAGYPIETFGVVIFFSISGYLITASWQRTPNLQVYMAARCLRIFPALLVLVVISVFVIGPLVTVLPVGDYFQRRDAWTYLGNALLRFQQPLPEVWDDHPDRSVNGSLWTLSVEFVCYLMVPAVLFLRRRLQVIAVIVLLVGAMVVTFEPNLAGLRLWNTDLGGLATMGLLFLAGALIRAWYARGHRLRPDVAFALLVAHLVLVKAVPGFQWHFGWVTLPYVVLWVGLASVPVLRSAGRRGDFSYGLYLWGYPAQQVVVDLFGHLPAWQNLPLVLLLAGGLAVVSWRLVEAPALRWKERIGGSRGEERLVSETR